MCRHGPMLVGHAGTEARITQPFWAVRYPRRHSSFHTVLRLPIVTLGRTPAWTQSGTTTSPSSRTSIRRRRTRFTIPPRASEAHPGADQARPGPRGASRCAVPSRHGPAPGATAGALEALKPFRAKLATGQAVFADTLALASEHFEYTPRRFYNGGTDNAAGTNEGSCKAFSLGRLLGLGKEEMLLSFGEHYRQVCGDPDGASHGAPDVRSFMRHGWDGVHFPDGLGLAFAGEARGGAAFLPSLPRACPAMPGWAGPGGPGIGARAPRDDRHGFGKHGYRDGPMFHRHENENEGEDEGEEDLFVVTSPPFHVW
ncbi:unnamed protein product [Prorocentrum cordatum]|uniref:Selenoprotein O n=1 Tax=Prorocentrum cordatum TaxID=2364126 RepID=A0ABN9XIG0_9DINO|nr:unnamed protein product [Polarella glacialis]